MGESSSVDWELCKENVQPLRRGRNVASLNTIFTISKDELSAQYTEEMRSFEEELLAYTGKDPLEMWIVYITWIEENRPQGGGSLLVSVLQKCIEKFCEDPRYVNDQRYFDIWKKYVSCCGKALEVYNYLHCNMIFQKLSTFYINWALELESCGNFKGANVVYDKGIRADAEPKDDLISYQQDFFARMAQDVISNLQSPTYENEMLSEDCRTSLRLLKPKDANNTVGIIRNETSSVNFGENQTSSSTNVVKKNRPAFKICGDENGDTNHLVGNIVQPSFKPKAIVSLVCNKENEQRAGKWTKNKLRNERLVPVKGGIEEPIFQIHQDAPSEMEGRKVTVPVVLNPKKIDDANIIEVVNSKKMENPTERVMYCKEKIYAGITEISFEELHAMRWKAKQEKIKMREEELLMQRKAYEEMAMQSRDAIVQEVMKLLKNSVTPGNSCSEITVSNIVHQQCANLHASCASASQEPSMDKCPRVADNLVAEPENICIFEDPVVVQPVETENAVNQIEVPKEETGVCHNDVSTFDDLDENDENVPPAGYVQVRESGPIAGILLPSTRVSFLEVDESESDSEEEEDDEEEEAENDVRSTQIPNNYEITMGMPTSTCQFATNAFIGSTPLGQIRPSTDAECTIMPNNCSFDKFCEDDNQLPCNNHLNTSPDKVASVAPEHVSCSLRCAMEPSVKVYEENPFNDTFLDSYLQTLESPLTDSENYITLNEKLPNFRSKSDVVLANDTYTIKQVSIAKGAFAKIHLAVPKKSGDTLSVALKVQQPACSWEYYISREIGDRLSKLYGNTSVTSLFAQITNAYIYNDGSVLVSNYYTFGTLLNIINVYKEKNLPIHESLMIYYAIELLDMIQTLHRCNIIHLDIKPDNILVQRIPEINALGKSCEEIFALAKSKPSLLLTDFGKSIDMSSFPSDTKFCYESAPNGLLCPEMKDKRPWTFQPDYFAVAGCVHCMLFGTYITIQNTTDCWMLCKKFHRNMSQVWQPFFHTLLNIPDCDHLPDVSNLQRLLQEDFKQPVNLKAFGGKMRELMIILSGK